MNHVAPPPDILSQWVPMPRYLLRCWVVKRLIRSLRPSDFIEIGAASGDMAQWISQRGIPGTAVEISPQALLMLRARFKNNDRVTIFDRDAGALRQPADLLLSMEVLEHIDDDRAALADWYRLVRPGGHLIMSVPSNPRLFSVEDEMAGHFRRYQRSELADKIQAAGFDQPEIFSYGFPLGLLLKQLRNFVARRRMHDDARSRQQRTEASGVDRRQFVRVRWLLNDVCLLPFQLVQMPFLKFDWTDGYIAVARKPAATK